MPLYAVVVLVVGCTVGPALSIGASVSIANSNDREQAAKRATAEATAREQARSLVCSFFAAQLDAYDETPPTTPAGRNLRESSARFYRASECQPPRR